MIGIDANVLVALAAESHPNHAQASAAFERELIAGEEFALSLSVAAEFLHVVTDPRRLNPALEMVEAVRWLREWCDEIAPTWVDGCDPAVERWLHWMTELQLGRKRILDTQYAALLSARGIRRLLTNNVDDFRVFKLFEIVTF